MIDLLKYYSIFINVVTFLAFFIDKMKAKYHRWRISEKTLLGLCVIGGALGGLLAMHIFRHKTKTPIFSYGVVIILMIHCILIGYCLLKFI